MIQPVSWSLRPPAGKKLHELLSPECWHVLSSCRFRRPIASWVRLVFLLSGWRHFPLDFDCTLGFFWEGPLSPRGCLHCSSHSCVVEPFCVSLLLGIGLLSPCLHSYSVEHTFGRSFSFRNEHHEGLGPQIEERKQPAPTGNEHHEHQPGLGHHESKSVSNQPPQETSVMSISRVWGLGHFSCSSHSCVG